MEHINLFRQIDEYCERTDFSFWAEPVNAITNFAIIFAGLLSLRLYHQQFPLHGHVHRPNVLMLIALVVLTGIGSFLYHTYATLWAGWADLLPIMVYIYLYHAVFLRRILAMQYRYVLLYITSFFFLSILLLSFFSPKALNGSIGYIPATLSFVVVWALMVKLRRPGSRLFGIAGGIFILAGFFRTIDSFICQYFPLGTHFLWHLCNAVVLYLMLKLVIQLPNFYKRQQRDKKHKYNRSRL
jgi:hypothetical protein